METVVWGIVILLFIVAFVGIVFPVIPSVLFIFAGFLAYGFFVSFEPFNWFFWVVQGMFTLLLFGADYAANIIGIKKYGGSKAAVWGSTIGLLVGPFVIPFLGILIGPFIGAVAAELIVHRKGLTESAKIGFGSVVGFISGAVAKTIIQAAMVIYFLIMVL
ncbi:hypothetical protein AM500_09145 [Bacillus sp. FJAT-18017]|uniref:DUF456 domain-containing protein n=1 Tax=Bacillus sp. FJAT-18017 TaxID=1705566 RepID=UPI0006AE8462|nr:DUF456 domain-containing protein [Bacillus sp. FJAT-18017]ALC89925.1 hypothetical protein AM500_09145 [Bacillus sp. FJAT-18017]